MRSIILGTLITAFTFALGAGIANASRGTRPSVTNFTSTASRLTWADEAGNFRVVCEVRLTISLHASIAKVRDTLAGLITAVDIRNCTGMSARVLAATLPWHVHYISFEGALPSAVTGMTLQTTFSFLLEGFFGSARCLYSGAIRSIAQGTRSELTRFTVEASDLIPLVDESLSAIACPGNGRFEGAFTNSNTVRLSLL